MPIYCMGSKEIPIGSSGPARQIRRNPDSLNGRGHLARLFYILKEWGYGAARGRLARQKMQGTIWLRGRMTRN